MSKAKKSRAQEVRHMEEELSRREREADSTMRLAMDTLDRGLEEARRTHRTAKRLTASVDALEVQPHLRLVASKK